MLIHEIKIKYKIWSLLHGCCSLETHSIRDKDGTTHDDNTADPSQSLDGRMQ
uniref:Pluripotency associated transcript 25 n=1 Tax=Mus musculus TaxID=10090 RepID=A0A1Y7VL79_MOUSE